jgi:hypothetical protein
VAGTQPGEQVAAHLDRFSELRCSCIVLTNPGIVVLTQLDPPLPLETSKGAGWTHFVIDYGTESALLWVVFMDAEGRAGRSRMPNRMTYNWTLGRRPDERSPDPPMRFPRHSPGTAA